LRMREIVKDNALSALIIGGIIGGSIILNGQLTKPDHFEGMSDSSNEEVFQFEGSLSELEDLDLGSLSEFDLEIEGIIEDAMSRDSSVEGGPRIKIKLRR
jgi:hypothetical protein